MTQPVVIIIKQWVVNAGVEREGVLASTCARTYWWLCEMCAHMCAAFLKEMIKNVGKGWWWWWWWCPGVG